MGHFLTLTVCVALVCHCITPYMSSWCVIAYHCMCRLGVPLPTSLYICRLVVSLHNSIYVVLVCNCLTLLICVALVYHWLVVNIPVACLSLTHIERATQWYFLKSLDNIYIVYNILCLNISSIYILNRVVRCSSKTSDFNTID